MLAVLVAVIVVAAAIAFTVTAYRRQWRWTGLPADPGDGSPAAAPRPAKTLWDWLQLLIVPLVLAAAAFGLNVAQVDRDRRQEERRAARDRASAEDRAREETLGTYLQQMSDLMTRSGRATADTETLAQTLTLVALRRLDGPRKGLVVQFLMEADLIEKAQLETVEPTPPAPDAALAPRRRLCGVQGRPACRRSGVSVSLANADLRDVVMPRPRSPVVVEAGPQGQPTEPGVRFDHADLRNADFHGGFLLGDTFDGADLRGANFSGASVDYTSFAGSCLSGARFDRVEVRHRADFSFVEGRGVDFSSAVLAKSTFEDARLTDVRLTNASTAGVRWPRGWTPTGIPMSAAKAGELCSRWER